MALSASVLCTLYWSQFRLHKFNEFKNEGKANSEPSTAQQNIPPFVLPSGYKCCLVARG